MRYLRLAVASLAILTALVGLPAFASGHIKEGSRFQFGARTWTNDQGGSATLPINLLITPRAHPVGGLPFARFREHVGQHIRADVDDETSLNCKHEAQRFVYFPGYSTRHNPDENIVLSTRKGGKNTPCDNRSHARLWYDTGNHTHEPGQGEFYTWLVGQIHHEVRGKIHPKDTVTHHDFNVSFDAAEASFAARMRNKPKSVSHTDARGLKPNRGHCTDTRYVFLPHSRGHFGGARVSDPKVRAKGGRFSNGKMTKVSMNHCG